MNDERVFLAAQKSYALYAAFFRAVAQELGTERALALHASVQAEQGIASARVLKDRMIDTPFNLQKLRFILQESDVKIGIDWQLAQMNGSSALLTNGHCSLYDGYRSGGLDEATAQELCQTGAAAKLGALLKEFDPRICYCLKFYRGTPDEACIEEISFHP